MVLLVKRRPGKLTKHNGNLERSQKADQANLVVLECVLCCTQEEARRLSERNEELEARLRRETGAAAAARESQEQLRSANMQLGLQLERLEQKLGAEQTAR